MRTNHIVKCSKILPTKSLTQIPPAKSLCGIPGWTSPFQTGPPSLVFFIWQRIIAAGITQRICQRAAAPPRGRNMEKGNGYYSGLKAHIPEHLQNGSQIAKKVIFFLIHTINTKFYLSLPLRINIYILCFLKSKLRNGVNGVKNACIHCSAMDTRIS